MRRTWGAILENIASAAALLDRADPSSVSKLIHYLSLAEGESESLPALAREGLNRCRKTAEELLQIDANPETKQNYSARAESRSSAESLIERLNKEISQLQRRPTTPCMKALELSDEELLHEFASSQRGSLHEIEAELLAMEKGSITSSDSLKRRIHTLKGEAGIVGLDAIAEVYHAIEDLLAAPNFSTHLSALLQVRDWLERSVDDIIAKRALAISPEETARKLRELAKSGTISGEERIAKADPAQSTERNNSQHPPDAKKGIQKSDTGSSVRTQEAVKIDVDRVDQLVEIIGELAVVESMVVNAPEIANIASPRIRNYLSQLNKITRDAQNIGMRMRMVPLRALFQKMARMVRDLSQKTGKPLQLEISGETTEMDRSMVEQIADPLIHMIRNAVDHGIEGPEDRKRSGKKPVGKISLKARYEGNHIAIEIADDGRGLNSNAIISRAVSLGFAKEHASLSEAEIFQLIFLPGFSTANKLTDLSGRGIGMDVVKRSVEAMRGRIGIKSVPGQGTSFRLLLPLTLAIIDGMLVRCGDERYILPTLSIIESVKPTRDMLITIASGGECINVRDEILPLIRLGGLLGIKGAEDDATQGLVVILEAMGSKSGLLVDQVVSQQRVVIKSIGAGMQAIPFISGGAILSDSTVGLIVNTEQIIFVNDRKNRLAFAS